MGDLPMRRGEVTQNDRIPYTKDENGSAKGLGYRLGECRIAFFPVVPDSGHVGIADRSGSDLEWLVVV
jgi:hypothetical protein